MAAEARRNWPTIGIQSATSSPVIMDKMPAIAAASACLTSMPATIPPKVVSTWDLSSSPAPPTIRATTMVTPMATMMSPEGPSIISVNDDPSPLNTPDAMNSAGNPKLNTPVRTAPAIEHGLVQSLAPMLPKVSCAELACSGQGNDSLSVVFHSGMPMTTTCGPIGCRYLVVAVSRLSRPDPSRDVQFGGSIAWPDGSKNST